MSFLMGGAKVPKGQATAVTPRLSDTQMIAREGANKLRSRRGIEDQILTGLGKRANNDNQSVSMLGRTAA